jgi:hypothetical protein
MRSLAICIPSNLEGIRASEEIAGSYSENAPMNEE